MATIRFQRLSPGDLRAAWTAERVVTCPEMRSSLLFSALAIAGCGGAIPAPASPLPSQAAAIERMRASAQGCNGVQATAKIDRRGDGGRIAGDLDMMVIAPQNLRMDVQSFGNVVATMTSDAKRFAFLDLRDKRFYVGPARPCNLARFTRVPIAGTALVELLRGQAPVLRDWQRTTSAVAPSWHGDGHYSVVLRDDHGNEEEIELAPHPDDVNKPWNAQRMRVVGVTVRQAGLVWYRAELGDHAPAPMSKERVDPEGIDPHSFPLRQRDVESTGAERAVPAPASAGCGARSRRL